MFSWFRKRRMKKQKNQAGERLEKQNVEPKDGIKYSLDETNDKQGRPKTILIIREDGEHGHIQIRRWDIERTI